MMTPTERRLNIYAGLYLLVGRKYEYQTAGISEEDILNYIEIFRQEQHLEFATDSQVAERMRKVRVAADPDTRRLPALADSSKPIGSGTPLAACEEVLKIPENREQLLAIARMALRTPEVQRMVKNRDQVWLFTGVLTRAIGFFLSEEKGELWDDSIALQINQKQEDLFK